MRRPTLREIECFVAVAEELHFSRAARRLHLSQPPLTRQIQQLEEAIGAPLLLRDRHSTTLTPAGRMFLRDAREMLVRVDRAAEAARRAAAGEIQRLTLGFVGALLAPDLIGILQRFRREHPHVQIQLADMLPAEQLAQLKAGTLDGAFPGALPRRFPKAFDGIVWKREALLVGIPQGHRLAAGRGKRIRLRALGDESWVMVSRTAAPAFRDQLDDLCDAAGFRPRITQESERVQAVLSMVAAGSGVSLVPETVAQLFSVGIVFKRLTDCRPVFEHSFISLKNHLSSDLEAFRKLISPGGRPMAPE
jgi:DNA-binding transcriptional LysR family regulator